MAEPLRYSKVIENKIREGIRNGVTIQVIMDSIQHLPDAPSSTQTLYNKYGNVIAEERARFHSYLGEKARERIDQGSDKILELALRSKAGWNPSVKVEEKDSEEADENQDAISTLAQMLGKELKPKDAQE